MAVRLESYTVANIPRSDTGADQIGRAIADAGRSIGQGISRVQNRMEAGQAQRRKQAISDAEAAAKSARDAEQKAKEQQQARDRIRAVDKLGSIQRDYIRGVQELDKTWIGSKTSPEYERAKKDLFNGLLAAQGGGLDEQVNKELQKSGKTWLNSQLLSDLKDAYKEELRMAEEAASNYANNAITAGAALGEQGDLERAQVAYGMTREELKNFADKTARDSNIPMKEFDANYMLSFLSGAAKSNPNLAYDMSSPQNLASFMNRDYEKDKGYFDTLSANLRKHLEKPIEYGRNKLALDQKRLEDDAKIQETIDFLNNPIIKGPNLETVQQRNKFGDVSVFKDLYYTSKGWNSDSNITDMINALGLDEDIAEIEYFDNIDKYIKQGMEADQAIQRVFDEHKNNPFKTADTLKSFYEQFKGFDSGLTDKINDLGLAEDVVSLAFDRVDKLIKAGADEDDALQQIFTEFSSGRAKHDVTAAELRQSTGSEDGTLIERIGDTALFNKKGGRPIRRVDLYKNITPEEAEEYIRKGASRKEILQAQAEKLYDNSGRVGNGDISNGDLHYLVKQVAGMTIDENGDVDNNLIKAFMARNYLQEHNASPEQINTFNNLISKALTDKNFKDGIAKLANRPSFDDLFAKTPGSSARTIDKYGNISTWKGVGSMFRSKQQDMNDYVENIGRQAEMGAMALLANGQVEEALEYYDQQVRAAYDFVKSDIIDTTLVNKVLANGGKPIVPVNGMMTEIVGRDSNGEYILRTTGRKVNGRF